MRPPGCLGALMPHCLDSGVSGNRFKECEVCMSIDTSVQCVGHSEKGLIMDETMAGMLAILKFQQQTKLMEAMVGMALQPQTVAMNKANNEEIRERAKLMLQCNPSMDPIEAFRKAKESMSDDVQIQALPA